MKEIMPPLEIDRLAPLEKGKPLGLTMAFVRRVGDETSGHNIYNTFSLGAYEQGYRVLLVNNTAINGQSQETPKPWGRFDQIHTVILPELTSSVNYADSLRLLQDLIPQYDFTIIGTGNTESQGSNGLMDLELDGLPPIVKNLVDRFVFDARQNIPNDMRHKAVTYASDPTNTIDNGTLAHHIAHMTHVPSNKGVVVLKRSMKGAYKASSVWVSYGSLPPVVAHMMHHDSPGHRKVIFGALTGLIAPNHFYINESVFNQVKSDFNKSDLTRKVTTGVFYALQNAAMTIPVFMLNAVGPEAFIASGTLGLMTSVVVGQIASEIHLNHGKSSKNPNPNINENAISSTLMANGLITKNASCLEIDSSSVDNEEVISISAMRQSGRMTLRTARKVHTQAIANYDAVCARWMEYELDILKFISAPLMRDLSCAETAQFFAAMHRSQTLLETLKSADDEDSIDLLMEFDKSVSDMVVAFERAEANAIHTGADFLEEGKKKNFDTAAQLMRVAYDEGSSITERASALTQGKKLLNKAVMTPQTAYLSIEGKVKALGYTTEFVA